MHEEGSSGGNSVSTSGQDMTKTNTTVSCTKKFLPYGQNHPPANLKASDQSHFKVESNRTIFCLFESMACARLLKCKEKPTHTTPTNSITIV